MKTKIAIAEDNRMLLKSVMEKLSFFDDFAVKFHGENGNVLLAELEQDHNIDLILMDIQMPEKDGIATTEIVRTKYPHIKVLMLTVFDDEENIFRAIKAGAHGYLLKDVDAETLKNGIISTLEGGASMSPSIALKALDLLRNAPITHVESKLDDSGITKREQEILEQLSKGHNYLTIAENLIISPSTVRKHIENIYKKLHAHNKVEAIQAATRKGLL